MHSEPDPSPRKPPATALRRALNVLGDPWTMLILKEAFNGTRRFSAFQRALNIPRQTLSLRLTHLCREAMMYRRPVSPSHATLEYVPTAKAFDLQEAMYSVWLWHQANPGDGDVLPFDIVHDCGHVLSARFHCTHCEAPITSASVKVIPTDPPQFDTEPRARLSRRNDGAITAAGAGDGLVAASLVGDIPCNEILWRLFQGPAHIQALADDLALGLPVVRGRLEKLRHLGMVQEQAEGRRLVCSILPRAEAFYPLLVSISAWGDRWCNGTRPPPEMLVHDCGNLLKGRFRCTHCGGWVGRGNVTIRPRTP